MILLFLLFLLLGCQKDSQLKKAQSALRIEDYPRAARLFETALEESPENPEARYGLAMSYYHAKQWEKSIREFNILNNLGIKDSSFAELHSRALYHQAKALITSDVQSSLELLWQSQKISTQNPLPMNLEALLQQELGNTAKANEAFARLVTTHPKFPSGWINWGELQWKEKQFEEALITWQLGLETLPNNPLLQAKTIWAEANLGLEASKANQ